MKLSVLIPMYNAEGFIERCLDSVMHQDLPKTEYEVVVFNDGSTDNSLKIVENYAKHYKNIVLYSHKNQGAYPTRNKLLKLAKGDYIYFVDADDYLVQNTLSTILDYALKFKLDIIGFNALVTHNVEDFKAETSPQNYKPSEIISGAQFLEDNRNMRLELWWYIFRKDFLESLNIDFIKINLADVIFTVQLFINAKKVAYIPVSVYRYFQSANSTMRTKSFDSKKLIISDFEALITNFSHLISSLDAYKVENANIIKDNLLHRRAIFTFFTISKMLKLRLSATSIQQKIESFKSNNAYPIKQFNHEGYDTFKYKTLLLLFNNEKILYGLAKTNHLFAKKSKK